MDITKIKEVRINYNPWAHIYYWVQAAPIEVSGLGRVIFKDDHVLINKVILLKQVGVGGHTDMAFQAMNDVLYDLVIKGKDPSDYRLLWHSHCNMQAFWSGDDAGYCAYHSQEMPMVFMVTNKRAETLVRIDYKGKTQRVPIKLVHTWGASKIGKCYRDVRRKVKHYSEVDRKTLREEYGIGYGYDAAEDDLVIHSEE